jgi:hypothetical protein
MKKVVLVSVVVLFCLSQCNKESGLEPLCSSPAFEIMLLDSIGARQNGFTIKAINAKNDTLWVDDSTHGYNNWLTYDTIYELNGNSGIYKLEIMKQGYDKIILENLSVNQGKFGVNPRIIKIKVHKIKLSKRVALPYTILLDSTGVGCGN